MEGWTYNEAENWMELLEYLIPYSVVNILFEIDKVAKSKIKVNIRTKTIKSRITIALNSSMVITDKMMK